MTDLIDHMVLSCASDLRLCRDPYEAITRRQLNLCEFRDEWSGIGGFARWAMDPDPPVICLRIEDLLLGLAMDAGERDHPHACRETLHSPADRRECGFVADQKPPVQVIGNKQRASRTADRNCIADLRLLRPLGCRSGLVQSEIDRQFLLLDVERPWGIIASRQFSPSVRNMKLDMVVRRRSSKADKVSATEDDTEHPRRHMPF